MIIPSFKEIDEVTDSRYAMVALVSKRARKIVDGEEPLVDTASFKPVTIAIEEVIKKEIVFGKAMSDREYAEKIAKERAEKTEIIIENMKSQEENTEDEA